MGARFRLQRPTERARELRNTPTEAEDLLWSRLRRSQLAGFKFSRQIPIAGFYPDFVCRTVKLIVELDGSQHIGAANFDAERTRTLEGLGYTVLRFWNNDLTTNMAGVLETILAAAQAISRAPTPQPPPARGRGSA